ncbi:hypothetical protein T03_11599 [Trichinella britovi]|uniref:Uncharacterized protein n=5 Tax=Trichinella TaxID=6333 RepID=A0A0V1BRK3_TRIBR|nr:hypothetical protein T03_11599 [Trichinella britovi]
MDEIYPFVSNMMMFKSCSSIVDYICIMAGGMIFTLCQVFNLMFGDLLDYSGFTEELCSFFEVPFCIEINPFVSNIIMFKSRVFIVEYVCSITGAVIFTFYQGLTSGLKFRTLQLGQSFPAAN